MHHKIPVTIISGFLGAGKTTLINKVLQEKHQQQIAVIINEFGEIGVDHQFVLDVKEEIYQMDNGCLCCTLRSDIVDLLASILKVKEQNHLQLDHILFETTGLADPAPIAQTFINMPFLKEHFILDAVLTVVDAKNFLNETIQQPEPAKQVAFADKIFISKHRLVDEPIYQKVLTKIKAINAFASIQDLDAQPVSMKDLFDLQLFYASEKKILAMQAHAQESFCKQCGKHHLHDHDHEHESHHEAHHQAINSFVIQAKEPLMLSQINEWLNELVYLYGPELYRYKGILNIEGLDYQLIFQGVQMSFDLSRGRDWQEEQRQSTLVFIGKNLPETTLRNSFIFCTQPT